MAKDLCQSCRFCELKVVIEHRPLFANSWQTQEVKVLSKWCSKNYRFKHKFQIKVNCGYKPKSGQISKHVQQVSL